MMFRSLRSRLSLTHYAMAVLVAVTITLLAYRAVEFSLYSQLQSDVMQSLHVFAGKITRVDGGNEVRPLVSETARALDGRVLVLNSLGRVMADSLDDGSLVGKVAVIDEVPDALLGDSAGALYRVQRGTFLYAAVPIIGDGKVIGVAFAAVRMDHVERRLQRFVSEMVNSLIMVLVAAAAMSIIVALSIGNSWKKLVRFIESAPTADYRHRIPARGMTELARLARAFNQMSDRLQRTEQARRDFVVEASTELEAPLRKIMESMADEALDQDQRLGVVEEMAMSMCYTVSQLLDLARLEMDTDTLRAGTVDLGLIVDETIESLQTTANSVGVRITRDDSIVTPVVILGDRKRLVAAISGLVRYCVSMAGEAGTVRVSLTEDNNNAFFAVAGTGPGIAQEDVGLIFERFLVRRQASAGDFLPERTGAGMAIARRVVELHGGAIEAKSGAAGGITFFARLPKKGLEASV